MADNPLKLKKIHHIEMWVGNAKQAAFFYRKAFGFSQLAYTGLETGERRQCGYVMGQGKATFLLTTPLAAGEAADHLHRHGDGVRDVAFEVDDADAAFAAAVARGARPAVEPHDLRDEHGAVRHAAIHTYGDTLHSFLSHKGYAGPFLPGFREAVAHGDETGILRVDHIVGNVGLGEMNQWANWYSDVLGFKRFLSFDDKDISTEYSALMSIVMADDSDSIKFPINEPAPGRKKSQIDEYLDAYGGPGVQHIALQTRDIVATVSALQRNGVEFLRVPDTYYRLLPDRVGAIAESLAELERLGILADRDQEGYLLQIFSKPVEDRPTLFYEIIERHGSRGFGKGNFRALFEAIEREQALRGNL
ncbi:MAG TPA: 4-hydroxyphenylpyruvate dioxygenase [Terriglobales bacterium]|nr:4-hydroxyphenylpyruvate dioxygenase [Terriglobales bacterium]